MPNLIFENESFVNAIFIFIVIVLTITLLFFIIAKINHPKEVEKYVLASCQVSCFLGMSIVVVLMFGTSTTTTETKKGIITEQKLISTQFNNQTSGKFLLGTGHIDNEDYVIYYTKKDNELVRNKAHVNNVKIIEDNTNPKVVTIQRKDITITKNIFGTDISEDTISPLIEFHVPAKSIIENINLN